MVDVLHTQLSAPIASPPLKRHWFPYDARDTCQRARRGPADDTLRRTHRPPDTRLKKHCLGQRTGDKLTAAGRGRAQKPRQRGKSFDPMAAVVGRYLLLSSMSSVCDR